MTQSEKERCDEVENALKRRGLSRPDSWWWAHVESPRHGDWSAIVPQLARELQDGQGKITDYYVNGLLETARKGIPAIDEVEGPTADAAARPTDAARPMSAPE